MLEKINKIIIPLSIIAVGIIITAAFVFVNQEKIKGPAVKELSAQQAAEKTINYINENLLAQGLVASLIDVSDAGSVYKIHLKIEEKEFESYVSKDAAFLFLEGYNMKEKIAVENEEDLTASSTEVPKSDNPDVKLFVMSYCPYGLQAQKMFLPVYDLLKDKVNMGVYFVNYIMHEKKEIDENLNQYCIQKEDKEKYSSYLSCFVQSGDSEGCFSQANIDKTKILACVAKTDTEYKITSQYNDKNTWLSGYYPKFDVQVELNEKYGVQGSPTIVINDSVIVQDQKYCPGGNIKCTIIPDIERSPEKFKEVICQSFNSPPEECSQALSNESPSPGIGGGTGSSGSGGCGQ